MPPDHSTHPSPAPAGALPAPVRWLLLALALLSLGLGIVGLFLPVIPTVPFLVVAAWAAARSSPRLLAWLEAQPRFGPALKDWRQGGVVRRRAKWTATAVMSASAVSLLVFAPALWAAGLAIACMAVVLAWLWMRPETLAQSP